MFGKGSLDQANPRRSIYLTVKRSNLIPMLQLFDAPDSIQSIGHRDVTTVPPQALAMMNSPLVRQLAEKFAKRVRRRSAERVDRNRSSSTGLRAWRLSRPPTDAEQAADDRFHSTMQAASYGDDAEANEQWPSPISVQLMLCLNEFVFVD